MARNSTNGNRLMKSQTVLELHSKMPTIVTFCNADIHEPGVEARALTIDHQTWLDMDCPETVTVTLEPGNTLAQLETPGFTLTGTESRGPLA